MVKLDDYVYRNLKEYGNCVMGERCIKKYGKQPILDHLQEKGFYVTIRKVTSYVDTRTKTKVKDTHYIIELLRRAPKY